MARNKNSSASKNRNSLTIAQMTDWDRKYLRQMAEQAKKAGNQKELDRLNKMYAKYGMSFGTLKGV